MSAGRTDGCASAVESAAAAKTIAAAQEFEAAHISVGLIRGIVRRDYVALIL
jgi:hypothetical protein